VVKAEYLESARWTYGQDQLRLTRPLHNTLPQDRFEGDALLTVSKDVVSWLLGGWTPPAGHQLEAGLRPRRSDPIIGSRSRARNGCRLYFLKILTIGPDNLYSC